MKVSGVSGKVEGANIGYIRERSHGASTSNGIANCVRGHDLDLITCPTDVTLFIDDKADCEILSEIWFLALNFCRVLVR